MLVSINQGQRQPIKLGVETYDNLSSNLEHTIGRTLSKKTSERVKQK